MRRRLNSKHSYVTLTIKYANKYTSYIDCILCIIAFKEAWHVAQVFPWWLLKRELTTSVERINRKDCHRQRWEILNRKKNTKKWYIRELCFFQKLLDKNFGIFSAINGNKIEHKCQYPKCMIFLLSTIWAELITVAWST